MNKILQLFSGGRDSFLSVCRLMDVEDNHVILANFTNGCTIGVNNVFHEIERLQKRYAGRVSYDGPYDVSGVYREYLYPVMNKTCKEIQDEYGEVTFSQVNCVACRMAMYTYAIALCRERGISEIADAARHSQKFVCQDKVLLTRVNSLLKEFDIDLLTPVLGVDSDWRRKNELLMYGFVPKTLEQQCLIGMPLEKNVTESTRTGVVAYYEKEIVPRVHALVSRIKLDQGKGGAYEYF